MKPDISAGGPRRRRWWQRIGPGLITACVVIGPGSILTSSKVGAQYGYRMNWVVILAVLCMMAYTTMSARLGVVTRESTGELVARRVGRWLAVLIGLSVFFIAASFQFGNNLGVHSAFQPYVDSPLVIVAFNALSIAFLFSFRNVYRAVERMMMFFVGLMLLAFALNLGFSRPDWGAWVAGFVPQLDWPPDVAVVGLIGTTFVITAAYYQSYLVKQKGWERKDVEDSLRDARIGSAIMAVITLMIMTTAASALRDRRLETVSQVAEQLQPLFGGWGQHIFCLGLFSAAYSSFLVNSMIGGFILADGLGLGDRPQGFVPRVFTTMVLLTGMLVALWSIHTKTRPVGAIVAAQAATVVVSPLMAFMLLWLCNCRQINPHPADRPGILTNLIAAAGLLLLLLMSGVVITHNIWPQVRT